MSRRAALALAWVAALGIPLAVRLWNALAGPMMWGYDAWGHVAYLLFLDLYGGVPWADQGWSYFHPPLHYALGVGLARVGDAVFLMRGLALIGSAASLLTAALAAWITARLHPERPLLAPLAFGVVAYLPVHFFVSPMPGNEMTATLLSCAALCLLIANDSRSAPDLRLDAATGIVAGLALLTKFSGLIPLAAVTATLLARRAVGRAALVGVVALAIAAPYYVRNVNAFGTPFQLSRDFPLVASVERGQPPGSRSWRDYVTFPARMFRDPDPRAPHMLHAVWPSVYANAWADVTRETDVAETPQSRRARARASGRMGLLGLVPTALAFLGTGLALRDVRRGRRRAVYGPLLAYGALQLLAFAVFAWRVPLWSALKASYLLGLSLPLAVFTVRAVEALEDRARWLRAGLLALLALVAGTAAASALEGLVLPRRADAPATAAVHYAFGEYAAARRIYARLLEGSGGALPWVESLAAVELADGQTGRGRALAARASQQARRAGSEHPLRTGRLAVALALDGDGDGARAALDAAIETARLPDLLANRGALAAARGDLDAARVDLRAAVELEPELIVAWRNLGVVLERAGDAAAAADVRRRTAEAACRAPRRYPYGLGTGEILEWGIGRRPLLRLEGAALRLATPDFFRGACRASRAAVHG